MEVPVLTQWQPQERRKASLGSTVAAVALLGFAVAALLLGGTQLDTFLLVILVLLLLVAVFQVLVVVTGLKQAPLAQAEAAGGNASWQEAYAPPPSAAPSPAPESASQITLRCSSCATVFDVTDTGERPLRHVCPGCGSEGLLTEEDLGPAPVASETAAAMPPAAVAGEAITLKCGNCATVFDVTDTGERPLHHTCPGCASEGVLREEDIGPAPAAAMAPPPPAARARAPAAPRAAAAGPAKTVKTLKLRCKKCSTVFTLRDTGERPLYHECPGCKATGVLR